MPGGNKTSLALSHGSQDVTILLPRSFKTTKQHLQCSFLRCDRGFQHIHWPGSHSWPQWSRACRNRCSCPDQCCYKWLHSCRACGECSSWDLERHSSTCGLATAQHMAGQQQQWQNVFLSSGTLDSLLPVVFCFLFLASWLCCSFWNNCCSVVVLLPQHWCLSC